MPLPHGRVYDFTVLPFFRYACATSPNALSVGLGGRRPLTPPLGSWRHFPGTRLPAIHTESSFFVFRISSSGLALSIRRSAHLPFSSVPNWSAAFRHLAPVAVEATITCIGVIPAFTM